MPITKLLYMCLLVAVAVIVAGGCGVILPSTAYSDIDVLFNTEDGTPFEVNGDPVFLDTQFLRQRGDVSRRLLDAVAGTGMRWTTAPRAVHR